MYEENTGRKRTICRVDRCFSHIRNGTAINKLYSFYATMFLYRQRQKRVVSEERANVNDYLERERKGAAVAYFKILSQHLSR
jgi:hypothetical protein